MCQFMTLNEINIDPTQYSGISWMEAAEVLDGENPLGYFMDVYQKMHEGDLIIGVIMALIFAMSSVIGIKDGLHLYVTGRSGRGKTSSIKSMLYQLPDRYVVDGRLSNQALFYANANIKSQITAFEKGEISENEVEWVIPPGAAIYYDDRELSTEVEALFKLSSSNYETGNKSNTLDKNNEFQEHSTPARISWILSTVEATLDEEQMNRLLLLQVEDSDEVRRNIINRIKKECSLEYKLASEEMNHRLQICKAAWDILKSNKIEVIIPFIDHIEEQLAIEPREFRKIKNMIESMASINRLKRNIVRRSSDGHPIIEAERADFEMIRPYLSMLFKHKQNLHLNPVEENLIKLLTEMKPKGGIFTVYDVEEYSKKTNNPMNIVKIRRALTGRSENKNKEGLIDKCSFIREIADDDKLALILPKSRIKRYYVNIEDVTEYLIPVEPVKLVNSGQHVPDHIVSTSLPTTG